MHYTFSSPNHIMRPWLTSVVNLEHKFTHQPHHHHISALTQKHTHKRTHGFKVLEPNFIQLFTIIRYTATDAQQRSGLWRARVVPRSANVAHVHHKHHGTATCLSPLDQGRF
ncbi:hypothetical protein AMTRI_Chr12g235240 [Amborella trichopoda]